MKQTGKHESKAQKNSETKITEKKIEDSALNPVSNESGGGEKENTQVLLVKEEIHDLLSNEDLVEAVKKFKADTSDKEIALEFANFHILFLNEIVESDYKKGVTRTDVEIRDMVAHVNMMLQKRDAYIFTTMVAHANSHYRHIQNKFYANIKKDESEKSVNE